MRHFHSEGTYIGGKGFLKATTLKLRECNYQKRTVGWNEGAKPNLS